MDDCCWCVLRRGANFRETLVKVFLSRTRAQEYANRRNSYYQALHETRREAYIIAAFKFDTVEEVQ